MSELTFDLPGDLYDELCDLAERESRDLAQIIRAALAAYLYPPRWGLPLTDIQLAELERWISTPAEEMA